jgi:hypothetical protein
MSKRRYVIRAISLYQDQAESLDAIKATLQRQGYHKASRSFVVQYAIMQLAETLEGRSPKEVEEWFRKRDRWWQARFRPRFTTVLGEGHSPTTAQ